MHICDHHIKVYYNIEKENWSKLKLKFIGGDRNGPVPEKPSRLCRNYRYFKFGIYVIMNQTYLQCGRK